MASSRIAATLCCVFALVGCAGGPIAIKSSINVQTVVVDGHSIDVAKDGDIWSATPASFISNFGLISAAEQARRVQRFRIAIERASGCQVVSSNTDPGTFALSATVQCKSSGPTAEQQTSKPATTPRTEPVAATKATASVGQDAGNAERLAKQQSCHASPRAVLAGKGPGFESYVVPCANGDLLMIRCEFGNCRALR